VELLLGSIAGTSEEGIIDGKDEREIVGLIDGSTVSPDLEGCGVGNNVGNWEGNMVGNKVGSIVGGVVGISDGLQLGIWVGR
jgi:outer membrane lipoprotein SlyB